MSTPPNNNPPDPNDPATFTGNSGVAATPTTPTTPTSTNTGATNSSGWYIWTYGAPTPIVPPAMPTVQWILGTTDPASAEPKSTEPARQQKVKRGNEEGYECQGCKVFNAYAELNEPRENPTLYICYSCRNQ